MFWFQIILAFITSRFRTQNFFKLIMFSGKKLYIKSVFWHKILLGPKTRFWTHIFLEYFFSQPKSFIDTLIKPFSYLGQKIVLKQNKIFFKSQNIVGYFSFRHPSIIVQYFMLLLRNFTFKKLLWFLVYAKVITLKCQYCPDFLSFWWIIDGA